MFNVSANSFLIVECHDELARDDLSNAHDLAAAGVALAHAQCDCWRGTPESELTLVNDQGSVTTSQSPRKLPSSVPYYVRRRFSSEFSRRSPDSLFMIVLLILLYPMH